MMARSFANDGEYGLRLDHVSAHEPIRSATALRRDTRSFGRRYAAEVEVEVDVDVDVDVWVPLEPAALMFATNSG